jgi:hypothetical protein
MQFGTTIESLPSVSKGGEKNDIDKNIKQELAADGNTSGVAAEPYGPYPFDTEKISISSKRISLSNVMNRLDRGLIYAAEMQRRSDLWDTERKSRLIESLMLKIPLPLFYAAENKNDQLFIVDGLQRLSAIKGYVKREYKLSSLEFLKDLEGKFFTSIDGIASDDDPEIIPENMRIRINETELDFVIIGPDSPPEVQRNIFKRLNTGGLPLTEQEIRNALYFGPITKLLAELVETNEFKKAVDNSVIDSRMAGQELILRFLTFSIMERNEYKKNDEMDSFLSDAMQVLNELIDPSFYSKNIMLLSAKRNYAAITIDDMKSKFFTAMTRAYELFANCAFRITTPRKKNMRPTRSPINKSLFESWSVILSGMEQGDFEILNKRKELLFEKLDAELNNENSKLRNYIAKDSLKITGVKGRYEIIENIIQNVIKEEK